jgi:AraC-like DNA-binding protein
MPSPTFQSHWDENEIERLHRLYSLRSQLAGFAAREAARRVGEGHSAASLEARLRAMHEQASRGDYVAFLEADMMFHRTIAQLAGAPPLDEIWIVLENRFREFAAWSHRILFRDLQIIADAHTPQYQTIANGNAVAAERAAHIDLDTLWQMLTEQPAEASDEADPVERVCGYILMNLHRKISLSQVARDVAHLSPSQLARLFRERRKESFSAYVQRLRLRRAETLLRETDLSITDISFRVGYTDSSRFTAHFSRYFGVTPSVKRETHST